MSADPSDLAIELRLFALEELWMTYQVKMLWDDYVPHPAFTDLQQAIAYAKGLLAQLPEDANPETEVNVLDEVGKIVFSCDLNAWRFAVLFVGEKAH